MKSFAQMSGFEPPTSDLVRAEYERHIALLGELADLGMDIARTLKDQALAARDARRFAAAFTRIARAVRLTLVLRERMIAALQAYRAVDHQGDEAAPLVALETARRRSQRKAEVEASVERVADANHDKDETERLVRDVRERLDREDYGDILSRPLHEIVAQICRDLGLETDWAKARFQIASGAIAQMHPLRRTGPPEEVEAGMAPPPGLADAPRRSQAP